ncbi:MAG: hypothetical protein V1717_03380 [Candidatus Micrarchaeota archaeon]
MATANEAFTPKVEYKKKLKKKSRMKRRYGTISVFHSPYSTMPARV